MTSPIHTIARAVIIEEDHILVCYNPNSTQPYTYLPGGHIEEGESAKEALIREMKEETSLDFKAGVTLGVLEYSFHKSFNIKPCHTHEYNFLFEASCSQLKGLKNPPEPEQETVRFKWVSLNNLKESNLLPSPLISLLPKWLSSRNNSFFSSEMI
jgi:8-oxo-dGTP diphosphatase